MGMTRLRARFRPVLVAVAAAVCLVPLITAAPATAVSADVVVSELMYHAPDEDAEFNALEFIELTNTGAGAIDLGGWSFSAGITVATADLALPPGLTIPAGGRVVGTSDPSLFLSKYGFPADFSYLGSSLSNGGETVTLVDSAAAVADTVTYDDAAPWVVSPDGGGPSPSSPTWAWTTRWPPVGTQAPRCSVPRGPPTRWHLCRSRPSRPLRQARQRASPWSCGPRRPSARHCSSPTR